MFNSTALFFVIQNFPGLTPLHVSALIGDAGGVAQLMNARADPRQPNALGLTPLDMLDQGTAGVRSRELLLS